jgi:DNA-binding PadR family transcriptional regulator
MFRLKIYLRRINIAHGGTTVHFHHHHGGHRCGPRGGGWHRGKRSWGPFEVEWSVSGGDRGSGRGRRRMFDGSELRLVLLKLIEEGPRHGYDLIREIEERTGGAYAPSPGVVYPTLTMLAEMDLIAEQASDGAKKVFAITQAGAAHLTEREEEVEALMARLAELGAHSERTSGGPIRRAMVNLRAALGGRLAQDADAETVHKIVELLDDTSRRIERL